MGYPPACLNHLGFCRFFMIYLLNILLYTASIISHGGDYG